LAHGENLQKKTSAAPRIFFASGFQIEIRKRNLGRLIDLELDSLEIAAPATDWDREENIQRMRAAMARMAPNIVEILNLRYKEGLNGA